METLRLILECLSLLCSAAITIAAFIGLRQLKISKETSRIASKRDAYKLAADQCTHYFTNIIPLVNKLDALVAERNIDLFKNANVEVVGKQIKSSYTLKDDYVAEFEIIAPELLNLLNAMEAFSVFFTSRLAAESVAFSSVGETFCHSTRELLPEIMLLNRKQHYRNLIQLFLLWNERIESRKLLLDKAAIEARLLKLDNKTVDPLGTADV